MKICHSKAEEKSGLTPGDDDNAAMAYFHRSTLLIIKLFDYNIRVPYFRGAIFVYTQKSPRNMGRFFEYRFLLL